MRFIIQVLISLILIFVLNIVFYFVSDDYRDFLKNIKYNSWTTWQEDIDVDIWMIKNEDIINQSFQKSWVTTDQTEIIFHPKEIWEEKKQTEVILWRNYKKILDVFDSFHLKELEINTSLFDITDEYPDPYYEFYSKQLTLYMFQSKTYDEVFDILEYLSRHSRFSLNWINNFWDKSFYINLDDVIKDNFIRIVIVKNGILFGIKVHSDSYDEVKKILQAL